MQPFMSPTSTTIEGKALFCGDRLLELVGNAVLWFALIIIIIIIRNLYSAIMPLGGYTGAEKSRIISCLSWTHVKATI